MEAAAADLDRFAARLDPLDRPGASSEPQVFDHIAQFFVTLGGQLGNLHALLHVRVVRVQRLELEGLAAQGGDDFGEARAGAEQLAVALVELLPLGIVQAQVERVAVGLCFAAGRHLIAQGFERAHLAEARQAAHQWQDP